MSVPQTTTKKYSAAVLPVIKIKDEAYIVAGADGRLIGKYHEKRNEWTNFYPNDVDFFGGGANEEEMALEILNKDYVFENTIRRETDEEMGMVFDRQYGGSLIMPLHFPADDHNRAPAFLDADFGVDDKGVYRLRRIFVCKWPAAWDLEVIQCHMLNNALGKNVAVNNHPPDPEFGQNPALEKRAPELYKVSELRVAMTNFARAANGDGKHIARHLPSYDIGGNRVVKSSYSVPTFGFTPDGIPTFTGTKPYEANPALAGLARVPFFAGEYLKKAGVDLVFDLIEKVVRE